MGLWFHCEGILEIYCTSMIQTDALKKQEEMEVATVQSVAVSCVTRADTNKQDDLSAKQIHRPSHSKCVTMIFFFFLYWAFIIIYSFSFYKA